jgi:hypothetical protein
VTKSALTAALAGTASIAASNAAVTVCLAARTPGGGMPNLHRLQLTRPCGQTGPGVRAVGTIGVAGDPRGHGGDELIV